MAFDRRYWGAGLLLCMIASCGAEQEMPESYGMAIERRIAEIRCLRLTDRRCQTFYAGGVAGATCASRALWAGRARAIDMGYVVVDESELERCLAVRSCLPGTLGAPGIAASDPLVSCRGAFAGTKPFGERCTIDEECAAGRCVYDPGETCGVCGPSLAIGESCARDSECGAESGNVSMCILETCTRVADGDTPVDAGAQCGLIAGADFSARSIECSEGLFCVMNGSALLTCVVPRNLGEPCVGGTCLEGECKSGLCRSVDVAATFGAPCGHDVAGAHIRCDAAEGLTCSNARTGGTCVEALATGSACDLEGPSCESGTCRGRICRGAGATGAPCTMAAQCSEGVCAGGSCLAGECG